MENAAMLVVLRCQREDGEYHGRARTSVGADPVLVNGSWSSRGVFTGRTALFKLRQLFPEGWHSRAHAWPCIA